MDQITDKSSHRPSSGNARAALLTAGASSIFEWDLNSKTDTDSGGTRDTDYDAVDVTGALTAKSTAISRVVLGTRATTGDLSFWQQTQTWSDIFGGGFTLSGSCFNNSLLQVVDAATGSTYDVSNPYSGAGPVSASAEHPSPGPPSPSPPARWPDCSSPPGCCVVAAPEAERSAVV